MKLIMENWRNFRRECNALSETSYYHHSTGSLESEFPEEKIIEDSFKLIDKCAPQFIKNSPYLRSVRFSRSESPTADKNSDGHMEGLYGKFTQDTIKPVINYVEVAFGEESPRAYLENITQWLAARGAQTEEFKGEKLDSAPFKGPDDLIFINLNSFIRGWALHVRDNFHGEESRPWAYSHWLVKMAGTIVHEVAHAEDKNHPKFTKFIYNKMLDRLNDAIDDGLFDRELYDDAWPFKSIGNSGKKAKAMQTFKEYLTQDLEALVTPLMAASEIYAYDTEINFYSAMKRHPSLHSRLRTSAGIEEEKTEKQKNNIVNKKYEKFTLSKTSDGT